MAWVTRAHRCHSAERLLPDHGGWRTRRTKPDAGATEDGPEAPELDAGTPENGAEVHEPNAATPENGAEVHGLNAGRMENGMEADPVTSENENVPTETQTRQMNSYGRIAEGHGPPVHADPGPVPMELDDAAFAQDGDELYRLALDLHQQGDLNNAADAYLHAEAAGVKEAAFNLGVLLYDTGDYDGAEVAWTRCLAQKHAKAATNLGFLLAQRGDIAHARLAYSAAELWGDPEAKRLAEDLPSPLDA